MAVWDRLLVLGLLLATPAGAQEPNPPADADAHVAQMIAQERAMVAPARALRPQCAAGNDVEGTIVVCAGRPARDQTVPSSADEAFYNTPQAKRGGVPHVPDTMVSNLPDCSPGHGCKSVGRAPPPIYYIDTTKLPHPPPGSDAEKIAKGEMAAP